MAEELRYRDVDAEELAGLRAPLERIYRQCFAAPPWSETEEHFARFPDRLADHLARPGAAGIVAYIEDVVAGVIYGWPASPTTPDSPFYAAVFAAVPPAQHHRLRAPALEIIELMVDPAHQGRGLGRDLLTRFLTGRPQAWLCTHPDAPACRLYTSAGFEQLAPFTSPTGAPLVTFAWSAASEASEQRRVS